MLLAASSLVGLAARMPDDGLLPMLATEKVVTEAGGRNAYRAEGTIPYRGSGKSRYRGPGKSPYRTACRTPYRPQSGYPASAASGRKHWTPLRGMKPGQPRFALKPLAVQQYAWMPDSGPGRNNRLSGSGRSEHAAVPPERNLLAERIPAFEDSLQRMQRCCLSMNGKEA